jgi:hypothetical protein
MVMGKKIFVSYKFNDDSVYPLIGKSNTTVRDYVDILEEMFKLSYDIYKGESSNNDLSIYSNDYIREKLKKRIYDTSITTVLISPNMKVPGRDQIYQWIPWEISYSLKKITRNGRTSQPNAVFLVVLPNINNTYNYFIDKCAQCFRKCEIINPYIAFRIIYSNMFNKTSKKSTYYCYRYNIDIIGPDLESSYIFTVTWDYFISNIHNTINRAINLQCNISDYNIVKEL